MAETTAPDAVLLARRSAVRHRKVLQDILECIDNDWPAGALALLDEFERTAADTAAKLRGAAERGTTA